MAILPRLCSVLLCSGIAPVATGKGIRPSLRCGKVWAQSYNGILRYQVALPVQVLLGVRRHYRQSKGLNGGS